MKVRSLRRVIGDALQRHLHMVAWEKYGESPNLIEPIALEDCIRSAINTVYGLCITNGIHVDRITIVRIAKRYLNKYIRRVRAYYKQTSPLV